MIRGWLADFHALLCRAAHLHERHDDQQDCLAILRHWALNYRKLTHGASPQVFYNITHFPGLRHPVRRRLLSSLRWRAKDLVRNTQDLFLRIILFVFTEQI